MADQIFNDINDNLQRDDIESMLTFETDDGIVQEMTSNIGFSGFNPIVTFNICMRLIGRDEERKKELMTLIIFGLTRGFGSGKTLQDILNRTKEEGKETLKSALSLFRVQFNAPRSNNTITISRIMVAFPILVYRLHKQLVDLGLKKMTNFEGSLPNYFQYPGSPAAMTQETWDLHKESYLEYCEWLAKLWGKEDEYDEDETDKYAELSFNSVLSPMSSRK